MKFFKYFVLELKLRFRNPGEVFFIFIFPIFLMMVFASAFGKNIPNYIPDNIALIMFYGILSASVSSLSVQISEYQSGKIYDLFRQRGITQFLYFIAQILTFMLIIFLSTLAIMAVAHFAYDYEIPKLGTLVIFYGKLYLYSLPFYFVALIIGLLSENTTKAAAIAAPVMFISYFLAGMMVPLSTMSGTMKDIAEQFFLTHLLSDLTHTLTKHYTITPNWTNISISVSLIVAVALLVMYKKQKRS